MSLKAASAHGAGCAVEEKDVTLTCLRGLIVPLWRWLWRTTSPSRCSARAFETRLIRRPASSAKVGSQLRIVVGPVFVMRSRPVAARPDRLWVRTRCARRTAPLGTA